MNINLLGHCLICLDKTEDKLISSSRNGPVSRMTLANKVLPQLLLEKSTEKENSIRDLFNQLHFCNSGGDGGEKEEEGNDQEPSASPPPLCASCLDKLSALLKLLDEVQLKTEELRSKIRGGGDGGEFENLLRGSDVVEEETKETTLGFLECLREECCDSTAIITPAEVIMEDGDDDQDVGGSNGGAEEDEDYQVLIVKDEEEIDEDDEDVVELPGPPPKNVPVVDISDDDEEAMMEEDDDDYSKVIEVEEFMVLPDGLIVDEVEGDPEDFQLDHQDSSSDGYGNPQILDVSGAGPSDGVPESESGPSKMFPCTFPNCSKSYTHHRYLIRHMTVAHRPANGPPKPFNCEYCGKGYNYKYNLKYHIESQHLRTNYICEVCGKGFAGNSHLKKHYHRHLGVKPFVCPNREKGCAKSFTDKSNLNSHVKRCQQLLKEK